MVYLGHVKGCGNEMPTTKKRLRNYLGAVSYYRKFIEGVAKYTARLTLATAKGAPGKVIWMDAPLPICVTVSLICVFSQYLLPQIHTLFIQMPHSFKGGDTSMFIAKMKSYLWDTMLGPRVQVFCHGN